MFGNFFRTIKEVFFGPPLKTQIEELILQDAIEEQKATTIVIAPTPTPKITELETVETKVEPIVIVEPAPVVEPVATVNDQITDAVTQAPVKPKRAKNTKGKFKADDKSTPEVNEAWEGGVAPAKKTITPKRAAAAKKQKNK